MGMVSHDTNMEDEFGATAYYAVVELVKEY